MADDPPSADDIQLEPPLVSDPDVQPAVEDRSYLLYVASALFMGLAGGFTLAVVLPLAATGFIPWEEGVPRLTQAHGWAQLQGWGGLFVAGMAMRLLPRFAGRPPLPKRVTLPVLLLLAPSIAVRTVVQPFVAGRVGQVLLVVAALAGAAGTAAVGVTLWVTLIRGRKRPEPWRDFARAAASWWVVWAVLMAIAGFRAAGNDRLTPFQFDDALTWIVLLGALGNVIWAVQSRSVPVFFGRKTPRRRQVAVPFFLLNAGVLAVAASLLAAPDAAVQRLLGGGLAMSGIAFLWLPPVAGAVWGKARRLRPRSRAASRYVLAANVAALTAGALLVWSGGSSLVTGEFEAFGARDAARHAIGLGLITMLIVGMAQLIAPVFALERAEARSPGFEDHLAWWCLVSAVVLRVVTGLLDGRVSYDNRMHLAAVAGALAWLGLVMFAAAVVRAVRKEPRMKALLAAAAMDEAKR